MNTNWQPKKTDPSDKRNSQMRARIIASVVMAGAASLSALAGVGVALFGREVSEANVPIFMLSAGVGAMTLFMVSIIRYLDRGEKAKKRHESSIEGVLHELNRLETRSVYLQSNAGIDERVLSEQVKDRVLSSASAKLIEDLQKGLEKKSGRDDVVQTLERSIARLREAAAKIGSRSNVNLALGSGISFFGVGALAYLAFTYKIDPGTPTAGWIYSIAVRLGFVLVIELLAYFFLRMYKSNQDEIRYVNNELTNVEHRSAAVRLSLEIGTPEAMLEIQKALTNVDRNHVLARDQTTVELEKTRMEYNSQSEFAKLLVDSFRARNSSGKPE